jgi:Domain of unknown function (DUF4845)
MPSQPLLAVVGCLQCVIFEESTEESTLKHWLQRGRERGGSKLNMILTLLILVVMVFAGVKIVPAYFANYQFQDSINTEARFAIVNDKGVEQIREDVWNKAQDLSIPLNKKEDIVVSASRSEVSISIDYSVPVDLIIYQFQLQFHPHSDSQKI